MFSPQNFLILFSHKYCLGSCELPQNCAIFFKIVKKNIGLSPFEYFLKVSIENFLRK